MISLRGIVMECEPAEISQTWLATAAKMPSKTEMRYSAFRSSRRAMSFVKDTS